jgi:hypothetical protein
MSDLPTAGALVAEAAHLLGCARVARMVAGDSVTVSRLGTLARLTLDEAEMLENVGQGHMVPSPTHPPGATIGWLLRYDASTRARRRLRGLPVPEGVIDRAA